MHAIRSFVTIRRAVVSALVVLLIAGVAWGVMGRGPSEKERAYALACEAMREQLKHPEDAVFPLLRDAGVEIADHPNGGYFIHSYLAIESKPEWGGVVTNGEVKVSLRDHQAREQLVRQSIP